MTFLPSILTSELVLMVLKWAIVFVAWSVLTFGLLREHRQTPRFTAQQSPALSRYLQSLHQRNLQFWIVLSLLLILSVAGDWRQIAPSVILRRQPASPPVSVLPAVPPSDQPVKSPQTAAPEDKNTLPFNEVTEFNEKNSREQAELDRLDQRFQDWLVTYYMLEHCGVAGQREYGIILASLRQNLKNMHADAQQETNILQAARGSYQELYSQGACTGQVFEATRSGFAASLKGRASMAPAGQ